MNNAIIANLSLELLKIDEWLKYDENKYYIFMKKKFKGEVKNKNFSKNIFITFIDNWDSFEVEREIIKLHSEINFSNIISFREEDILRVAKLREFLKIDGQNLKNALLFRDKYLMKTYLQSIGLCKTKLAPIDDYIDCLKFVNDVGFPIVLKPRTGLGSVNTFVINNENELYEVVSHNNIQNYISEEYIEGDVFHVDILVNNYEIKYASTAKYVNNCLAYKEGKSTASVFLPYNNEKSKKMISFAKNIISHMPIEKNSIFHVEIFDSPQGLELCEIACRAGGAQIVPIVDRAYGINLYQDYLYANISSISDDNLSFYKATTPQGYLMVSPQEGKIVSFPTEIDFPNIEKYEIYAKKGREYSKANSSVYSIASFEISGTTIEEVSQNLQELDYIYKSNVVYEKINKNDDC